MSNLHYDPRTQTVSDDSGRQVWPPTQATILRDYFAAASLAGLKANNDLLRMIAEQTKDDGITLPEALAIMAYKDADAMLKERAK